MRYKIQETKKLNDKKHIYFVGIKGVGMTSLAIMACEAGLDVAGSDVGEVYITDKKLKEKNIVVEAGFTSEKIEAFFSGKNKEECLVVTTGAHKGFDSPQCLWAKEKGYDLISQGQALGQFMDGDIFDRDFKGIAVAASHGKTTISSLLATTLRFLNEDASYAVGTGEIYPLGTPGHYGEGGYFVAEADEYASEPVYDKIPKFLYLNPHYAIFNNIDFDHPDMFDSIADIEEAFFELSNNIKSGGILFLNSDDARLKALRERIIKDIRVVSFGTDSDNNYSIGKVVTKGLSSQFTVFKKGVEVGFFELNLVGEHNAKNSLAVIAMLLELGYPANDVRTALSEFKGTKRRLEKVGRGAAGSAIFDDYAHHPLEISTTLKALKSAYPDKKIVCIFQPHTFSRTKALFSEFSKAFVNVDKLILLPVFKSQRDVEKDSIDTKALYDEIKNNKDAEFFEDFEGVIEYINQNIIDESIIITMGAGDVYKIATKLVND